MLGSTVLIVSTASESPREGRVAAEDCAVLAADEENIFCTSGGVSAAAVGVSGAGARVCQATEIVSYDGCLCVAVVVAIDAADSGDYDGSFGYTGDRYIE